MQPRILVVGTGAVGALYAWRLQAAGGHVSCICRSNYEQVTKNGFDMRSFSFGNAIFRPDRVFASVQEATDAEPAGYHYIIVCTKALPERVSTADLIAPAMTESKTAVVLIQNGVGIEQPVAERFPQNPCVSCIAYVGVTQTAPGVIEHVLLGDLTFGPYNRDGATEQTRPADVDSIIKLMSSGGIKCSAAHHIQAMRWNKLTWNAPFGAASVLTGLHDTHTMLDNTECAKLIKEAMEEIWQAATMMFGPENFPGPGPVTSPMAQITRTRAAAAYKPSITVDYTNGSPMEVEVIFGNAVREAKKRGIPMPRLELLYLMMRIAGQRS
ncbi:ketopantoate reductase PanE/ApbA-domain-containing protein [Thamnocephalis sphaerospora]|uniref:2-dehydropantoate 2-reductase n=1 Tax=Thamnocephalis sphaerospora TaxID=78915 RepID=A0A4V1IVZ5_9FUNG|nr:ketopantoate reductase PanE/ApbA-domain-containing protein [Thamnocephalis sphaerospora]|eukprot:RKP05779.1 ketopantoate reductase PanE/ApbA-domain-containing protein [Thamnocephalis sphaerospora]